MDMTLDANVVSEEAGSQVALEELRLWELPLGLTAMGTAEVIIA